MALHFVYIDFVYPLYKKGGFGGPKCCIHASQVFLDILAIKMPEFLKLEHLLRPF